MGASTVGYSYGTVDIATKKQSMSLSGSYTAVSGASEHYLGVQISTSSPPSSNNYAYNTSTGGGGYGPYGPYPPDLPRSLDTLADGQTIGVWLHAPLCDCDTVYYFRAVERYAVGASGTKYGSILSFKSYAIDATSGTPASSSVTATTATISDTYYPNTLTSTASVSLEYKRTIDSTWTTAGVADTASGYTVQSISRNLTGLAANTSYQFRLSMTRTTVNSTTHTSVTSSFTTPANTPVATTTAATSIANTSADLNGTIDGNNVASHWVIFYTANPGSYVEGWSGGLQTISQADGTYSVSITASSLTPSTTYYFKLRVYYNSDAAYLEGSELSFTTAADPEAVALLEDQVNHFEYDRVYGAATTVYFTVVSPSATSSDRLFNAASPFVAGDIKISVDNGANWANIDTLPTRLSTTPWFSLPLLAAETAAEDVLIYVVDQNGPAFRDATLHIRTKVQTGQVTVNAANLTNTTAMTLTGVGSGHGLSCVGGATGLDIDGVLGQMVLLHGVAKAAGTDGTHLELTDCVGVNAGNDFYNNSIAMIVAGTGVGESRVIKDYVGATKIAEVYPAFPVAPNGTSEVVIVPGPDVWNFVAGAELSAIPTFSSPIYQLLQLLFQRFVYARKQDASSQILYKADGTTQLASGAFTDSTTFQSIAKLT